MEKMVDGNERNVSNKHTHSVCVYVFDLVSLRWYLNFFVVVMLKLSFRDSSNFLSNKFSREVT